MVALKGCSTFFFAVRRNVECFSELAGVGWGCAGPLLRIRQPLAAPTGEVTKTSDVMT